MKNQTPLRKMIALTFLLFFLGQIGWAQPFDKAKLDSYFEALEANNKFMGSVAVSKDGRIIYSKSVGYCDVENNKKANEDSKYRIGSISKTFTAVLVLKAVEENKLDLNQTIDKYFPSIENAEKIAIKHLLNHRSGIHNFTNDLSYLEWNTQAKSEKEMLEIISKAGSDFEPNSRGEYSNSNFVLLSYILERVWGQPYAELLQQKIVDPIGLEHTFFGGQINTDNNECKSYKFAGSWNLQDETDTSIPLGAGGIISTPIDLTKFGDALFMGKLLKPESLELMKTMKDNFGYGLFQIPFYDRTSYGHNGGIDGFSSSFAFFEDGNISFALTSNGSNFINNNIAIAVLSAVFDRPYDVPTFTTYDVSDEELEKYVGVYASKEIPLKITITKENKTLIGQATGQPSFPLEATEKDKFKFEQAGVVLEFDPSEQTMILNQGGAQYTFMKE